MSNEEMKDALLDKLTAEQDTYRAWLLEQTPEEILNHTYEYTMREDIIVCMEELDLTDAQAAALLASTSPMQDIYNEFNKRDASYMEDIQDSIETRAKATLAVWQSPLYTQSGAYASEHGELDAYRSSNKANLACKEAIHSAIRDSYHDNCLDTKEAVRQVVDVFGYDRTFYILALTVRHMDWDGRFSRDNKEWAKTIPVPVDHDAWRNDRTVQYIVSQSHPGLVDLFLKQARKDYLLTQPLTAEEIKTGAAPLSAKRASTSKIVVDKYFRYLEKLRDSGETNMYGAVPNLQDEFPELRYDPERAKEVLIAWFKSFEKGRDTQ